jgi:hypothetical protein
MDCCRDAVDAEQKRMGYYPGAVHLDEHPVLDAEQLPALEQVALARQAVLVELAQQEVQFSFQLVFQQQVLHQLVAVLPLLAQQLFSLALSSQVAQL